jgi:hypothetical protein
MQANFHFCLDFGSVNANRDAAVVDADDMDALCVPGTRSIQLSETAASTQRDGVDLAADFVADTADTAACEEARGGIAVVDVAADTERAAAVAEEGVGNTRRVRFDQYKIRVVVVIVDDVDDNNTVVDDDDHPIPVLGGCAPV